MSTFIQEEMPQLDQNAKAGEEGASFFLSSFRLPPLLLLLLLLVLTGRFEYNILSSTLT